jgi:hypothetical protein
LTRAPIVLLLAAACGRLDVRRDVEVADVAGIERVARLVHGGRRTM